jgi:hypothetical protein
LIDNAALLLPVHYFLVTFTVPDGLRRWIRSHPALGYDLLLAASSQALQDLAQNPKRLGATLGLLGVLHTWTRTLEYHPHVHYLVPGGGLSLNQRQWISSRPKFLLPVKALSDRCRTLFREALQKRMPGALADLPAKVWTQRWVVHSAAVGSGQKALGYLSRYVFKTATAIARLNYCPTDDYDGRSGRVARENGSKSNSNLLSSCAVSSSTFFPQAFIESVASDGCTPVPEPNSSACAPCSKCRPCFQSLSKQPGRHQCPALRPIPLRLSRPMPSNPRLFVAHTVAANSQ